MWRVNTPRFWHTSALVFCGPPPCTRATSIVVTRSTVAPARWPPIGATTRRARLAITNRSRARRSLSATPATAISTTRKGEPKRRADIAIGVSTPAMASVAIGTPPNGQFQRTRAARARAAGNTIRRCRCPAGVAHPAAATMAAKAAAATGQPGGVRSNIQTVPGNAQLDPTSSDRRKRMRGEGSSIRRNQRARPAMVSGHQPHGGRPAAMASPARTARRRGCFRSGAVERAVVGEGPIPPFYPDAVVTQTSWPQIGHGCLPRSDHSARAIASCHHGSTSTGSRPTSHGKNRPATSSQVVWSNW